MSNVSLMIGGREYTVACAAGEEAHVTSLGSLIAEKLSAMPGHVALSEPRSLLFAALLLADEVHEQRLAPPATEAPFPAALSEGLEAIAARLENIATHLEQRLTSA